MSITDRFGRHDHRTVIAISLGGLITFFTLMHFLFSPPQLGGEEEILQTVDALFTALNSRDTQRLADCEQRLRSQREAGRLPTAAAANLDSIIKQARSKQWEASAHRLYDFVLAQRRAN